MRFLHRIYARMFGYFWLPCPICRKPFGGHQVKMYSVPLIDEYGGKSCVCPEPQCSYEAAIRNMKWRRGQFEFRQIRENHK